MGRDREAEQLPVERQRYTTGSGFRINHGYTVNGRKKPEGICADFQTAGGFHSPAEQAWPGNAVCDPGKIPLGAGKELNVPGLPQHGSIRGIEEKGTVFGVTFQHPAVKMETPQGDGAVPIIPDNSVDPGAQIQLPNGGSGTVVQQTLIRGEQWGILRIRRKGNPVNLLKLPVQTDQLPVAGIPQVIPRYEDGRVVWVKRSVQSTRGGSV